MTELNSLEEKLSGHEQTARQLPKVNPEVVSAELLTTASGKFKTLIEEGLTEGIKLTRRGLEIRFKDRVPLDSIEITHGPTLINNLKIEVTDNGESVEFVPQAVDGQQNKVVAKIMKCTDGLRVKADGLSSLVTSPTLLQIKPLIISNQAMSALMDLANRQDEIKRGIHSEIANAKTLISSERQKISDERTAASKQAESEKADIQTQKTNLENRRTEIEALVSNKNIEKQDIETQIVGLTQKQTEANALLANTQANVDSLESKIIEQKQTLTNLEDTIQQRNSEKDGLSAELADLKKQVVEWTNNKNLFTAELDGVLGEYNTQFYTYLVGAGIVLGLISLFGYELYKSAAQFLSTVTPGMSAEAIWTYSASRSPYVAISLAIFFGLLNWAFKPLVLKVFEINDLRSLLQARVMLVTKLTRGISAKLDMSKEEEASVLVDEKMKYIEETLADHFSNKLNAKALAKLMADNDVSTPGLAAKLISKVTGRSSNEGKSE